MSIDVGKLVQQILSALKLEVSDGWESISSFSETQAKKIATQSAMIVSERTKGALKEDDDLFEFFVEQLKRLVENFARSVAAMTIATLEKVWNAVVGSVWNAINGALDAAGFGSLALPKAPSM